MKKDKEKTINFNNSIDDNEEVPYFNNDGDIMQDSIKEIEEVVKSLQSDFVSQDNNNVVTINFKKDKYDNK